MRSIRNLLLKKDNKPKRKLGFYTQTPISIESIIGIHFVGEDRFPIDEVYKNQTQLPRLRTPCIGFL